MFPIQGNQPDETLYVDDVFSTYLYTGNGSTQTITNGIDLAGKGGLVWTKIRNTGGIGYYHYLWDTVRGTYNSLSSEYTNGNFSRSFGTTYNNNGFNLIGDQSSGYGHNAPGQSYASWTFRQAPKFFSQATATVTGGADATVSFSDLTTLGMAIVKRTDSTGSWYVWHRSLSQENLLTYSEQFDNAAWNKLNILAFGSGSTANATTAPDGTTTADKITENTATNYHGVYQTKTVSAGATLTVSCYARAAERSWIIVEAFDGVGYPTAYFNLSAGTVGTVSAGVITANITSVGGGWYRCSTTYTMQSGTSTNAYMLLATGNGAANYAGDGTSGIHIWGAQLNQGSLPANYQQATSSASAGKLLYLEQTAAEATLGHITVSGTTVTLKGGVIANGTYIVYGFAHDTSADGIIQCGSFTTDGGGNATVNLGWEPQFVLVKRTSTTGDWHLIDTMRGFTAPTSNAVNLFANSSASESVAGGITCNVNSQGFTISLGPSTTQVYLAIRRPNKPPTSGTQVYNAIARTGTGAAATVTGVGFAPDVVLGKGRNVNAQTSATFVDRLRGIRAELYTAAAAAEVASASNLGSVNALTMDGCNLDADASGGYFNYNTGTYINHFFRRAPGVFDVVCYTGTGVARTVNHNLGVVPEMMIAKHRNATDGWLVYEASLGVNKYLYLNLDWAAGTGSIVNSTLPTSSVFTIGADSSVNGSGSTYIAYLFATKPGISKVGSYTGNGSSQTINCGFTAGARFILIKRTDSTGDWFVWDSTRGIVAGNDPHLSLNTTAAEVTTDDSIDPDNSGFIINQLAATNINVTSATYIYLAFA